MFISCQRKKPWTTFFLSTRTAREQLGIPSRAPRECAKLLVYQPWLSIRTASKRIFLLLCQGCSVSALRLNVRLGVFRRSRSRTSAYTPRDETRKAYADASQFLLAHKLRFDFFLVHAFVDIIPTRPSTIGFMCVGLLYRV